MKRWRTNGRGRETFAMYVKLRNDQLDTWNSIHSLVVKYLPSKQGSWVRFPLDATFLFAFLLKILLYLPFRRILSNRGM
jgi:hypothetical protein